MGPMLLRHTRYYNIGRSYVISKEHLLACLLTGVATLPQSVPCGGTGGGHVETLDFFDGLCWNQSPARCRPRMCAVARYNVCCPLIVPHDRNVTVTCVVRNNSGDV